MLTLLLVLACGETQAPEVPVAEQAAAPVAVEVEAAPADARRVFFVSPKSGETITSPVKIVMGIEGMEIRPAGELAENTGHHHIVIGPAGIPEGTAVPADERHIHFGAGQTEAELELPPGEHKLTLQFADGNHTSYGEPLASTITVTVQ